MSRWCVDLPCCNLLRRGVAVGTWQGPRSQCVNGVSLYFAVTNPVRAWHDSRRMALLDEAQARRARRVLGDLSRRLLALRPGHVHDGSLAEGHAGIALAHAALDRAFPRAGHAAAARRALGHAMAAAAAQPMSASLFAGFTGIAWVAQLIAGEASSAGEDDRLSAVDEALDVHLAASPWRGSFDLIEGLVGICVYAIERLPRPAGQRILARAVAHLSRTARRLRGGIAWRTEPQPGLSGEVRSGGLYNLGVAHGMPGVIAVLSQILVAEVPAGLRAEVRSLLGGAVAWLMAQELPDDALGCFAWAVGRGIPREAAHLGWCYGDPAVAVSMLLAGRAAREAAWERAGRRIARRSAARPLETVRHADASLCHGTAGTAHLFHRLWQLTGDAVLADAARLWFARALAMQRPGRGFAGYAAFRPALDRPRPWRADPGFLMGGAGVALALVSATGESMLRWDRALLLA